MNTEKQKYIYTVCVSCGYRLFDRLDSIRIDWEYEDIDYDKCKRCQSMLNKADPEMIKWLKDTLTKLEERIVSEFREELNSMKDKLRRL